ncbi:MAG: polyprenyl synthetase family protein [Psittacicella sp.]
MKLSLQDSQNRINSFLEKEIDSIISQDTNLNKNLLSAIKYCLINTGKRIRPHFVYLFGECFNASFEDLDYIAASLECIHTYSLIHDDMPTMDNDDYRHGKKSCHKEFNEATALLAGDALQSLAFEFITRAPKLTASQKIKIVSILSKSIGPAGMCLGQDLELNLTSTNSNKENIENQLNTIFILKTAKLLESACICGFLSSSSYNNTEYFNIISKYGLNIGLNFQLQDEVFDQDKNEKYYENLYIETLGKKYLKEKIELLYQNSTKFLEKLPNNSNLIKFNEILKNRTF